MAEFMIRFLICNIFIVIITGIFFAVRKIFKSCMTPRMAYNLWFVLLILLVFPFIPFSLINFPQIFYNIDFKNFALSDSQNYLSQKFDLDIYNNVGLINDFALSVNNKTSSIVGYILFLVWISGILMMIIFLIKSYFHLRSLKKSALPLQNQEVIKLYHKCLKEFNITADIQICSTVYLKSPIITGLFKSCIYLPVHIISDYNETEMRYILLHELSHYKHKDTLAGYFITLANIIYWFNPIVRYSLKEMRNDREIACDTSVLKLLEKDCYTDYGNTLINFAQKIFLSSFPFSVGISGNMKQMKRRILNIARYEIPTIGKKIKSTAAFLLSVMLLSIFAPFISTYAADNDIYQWNLLSESSANIEYRDLSSHFGTYNGSFVLYDLKNDTWNIHDIKGATKRVSPNSTYKIYNALLGLEAGVITADNSLLKWSGQKYPFEAWNDNHTLDSAMNYSVNWYFQEIDKKLGINIVSEYIQEIGYGNKQINNNLSGYWLESSLKISPVEQVELLTKLYNNDFNFSLKNINVVKNSILISSSDTRKIYGKTGTGRIGGHDVNGWFIGFVETADNAFVFATNISAENEAAGSNAAAITMSILSELDII